MADKPTCRKKIKTGDHKGDPCKLLPGHSGKCRSVLPGSKGSTASTAATARVDVDSINLAGATPPLTPPLSPLPVKEMTESLLAGAFKSRLAEKVVKRKNKTGVTWSVTGSNAFRSESARCPFRIDVEDTRQSSEVNEYSETDWSNFESKASADLPVQFSTVDEEQGTKSYRTLDADMSDVEWHSAELGSVGDAREVFKHMTTVACSKQNINNMNYRPQLQCVRVENDGTMLVTDSYRLMIRNGGPQVNEGNTSFGSFRAPNEDALTDGLMIPGFALKEFFKAYGKVHGTNKAAQAQPIEFGTASIPNSDDKMLLIRAGNVTMRVGDVEHNFPGWKDLVNTVWEEQIEDVPAIGSLDVQSLKAAAKQAVKAKSKAIIFDFQPDKDPTVEFTYEGATYRDIEKYPCGNVTDSQLADRAVSSEFVAHFNPQYLLDALESLDGDKEVRFLAPKVKVERGGLMTPVLLVSASQTEKKVKDADLSQMLMTIRPD